LTESQKGLTESQKGLTESQKTTDERLNALIDVVERHITGHNHGQQAMGEQ
jgi:hypothetical protein